MRNHAATLGLQLPVTLGGLGGHHILCSQFADDTTLYSDKETNITTALRLVVTEFCAAAGARLNIPKTKIFDALASDARRLRGSDFVKSLGVIYSEQTIPPEARFDKVVVVEVEARMARVQSQHGSLMARVLLTNSLLSSCIWFSPTSSLPPPPRQTASMQ